jgi:hypothetical protein
MGDSHIEENRLLVDGKPFYIRGGEVQYFRLPVDSWKSRLQSAKACGLNTITAYMPWYWHEPVEGAVDLTGHTMPERNLRAFLEMAHELGLKVVARPGPFINSELRCGGIPEWLFRNHPETMSHRADGEVCTGRPIPAEGEPAYRRYVREWYRQIIPVIAEYDIHNGGPVILFQPDNELSAAWSFGLLNSLYDPTILGTYWPDWLRANYGDISAVGNRYGKQYKEFTDIEPPRSFPSTQQEKNCCMDWMDFKRRFFADWGATLAKWADEDGIRVPIVFNEPVAGYYGHGDHSGFGSVQKMSGISGMTACHTYSDRLVDLEGASRIAEAVEITRSSPWDGPPVSIEVNTNWFIPRLSRSDINWSPLLRIGLAHGLEGTVIYPFTAGVADAKDTINGSEYFEPSCVDMSGSPTGSYEEYQRFNKFVSAWEPEIHASDTVPEVTVAFTPAQRQLDFLGAPPLFASKRAEAPGGDAFDAEPGLDRGTGSPSHDWLDGYEGVSKQTVPAESGIWKKTKESIILLSRLNVSFDMLDLVNPKRQPGTGCIIVACTGCLEPQSIDYLIRHMEAGGSCLFYPTIPVRTPDGCTDTRIADLLGVNITGTVRPAGGDILDYGSRELVLSGGSKVDYTGWIFLHSFPPASSIVATHEGQPVTAVVNAGKGRAIVSGADMSFTSYATLDMWNKVLRQHMGISPAVNVHGSYIYALPRFGKDAGLLTVANICGISGRSEIELNNPTSRIDHLRFSIQLGLHEARCLPIGVHTAAGRILYATSELIPLDESRQAFELHGAPCTEGEIAFDRQVSAILNGSPFSTVREGDMHILRYTHEETPGVLCLV